jgi:bifunctional DNA-binding transcriptional regulator/antitoxin component of YhaV-PrlF toxin-antitoxin module
MPYTSKITDKGQVTLPRAVRNFLGESVIEFEIEDTAVVLRPVSSVGGNLRKYAKNYQPLKKIRNQVAEEIANDKIKKHSS